MLSSPPDVLLKEEGTTAASVAFLPQGYCFFPHPPVSLHGHLYIWHCPSGTTQSCHHCLAELAVDLVRGCLSPRVSPRDPSYLFAPLGLIFMFPHAPIPKDGATSCWPYWDAKIAILQSAFLFSEATECFCTCFLFIICDMASFFLNIGVSGIGEAVVIFLTGLYVYATVGLSFA